MVAGGHAWLWGGHVWLQGGCMFAGGMRGCRGCVRGCRGACMVARGHTWLLGGVHCCWGVRGCGGHVWLWGTCMVAGGGMRGIRRDTVNERAVRILLECILVLNKTLGVTTINLPFVPSYPEMAILAFSDFRLQWQDLTNEGSNFLLSR